VREKPTAKKAQVQAPTPKDASDPLEDFHQRLQQLAVDQAKKIIDLHLYQKALLSTLPVALLGTDRSGRIRTVNHAAEDILGCAAQEFMGRPLVELFGSRSDAADKIRQAMEEGAPFHMDAKRLQLASEHKIVGNFYFHPLRDDEQEICGILLTIEDVTYMHYLHSAFTRYVPPSVSEIIARDPQSLKLGGEEKELTVLFSDLVGFTSIAEKHSPREMVTLLSDYFSEMTAEVFAWEGTLKEYVGDELMAIFGAPIHQPDHAVRACRTALAMSRRLAQMRRTWPKRGRPALHARIGVNTGPMLVGNLGSPHRFSYGVVGDQVNLGSRLEGLNTAYRTEILVGETTAESVADDFRLREVDRVRVKGRQQSVAVYELLGDGEDPLDPDRRAAMECYAEALGQYRARRWEGAEALFRKAESIGDRTGPSAVMAERCRKFRENPPGDDWDGAYDHLKKK
jgi:PAS domain S-box-containing protein